MATVAPTITLRDLLANWDLADLSSEDPSFLDRVGLEDFAITDLGNGTRIRLTLSFADELGFKFPGLDCLGLYFGSQGSTNTITVQCEIGPVVSFRLVNVGATLRFKQALLRRVVAKPNSGFKPLLDTDGAPIPAQITLSGIDIVYTVGGSLELVTPTGGPQLSLPPTMIADTGVVIESTAITLHLNRDALPPAGATQGFTGVHIASAKVYLPESLAGVVPPNLAFTNARIGSDGFSGTISLSNMAFTGSLGSARFTLSSVGLSFERNVLTGSAIGGEIKLPFFDKPLALEFGIAGNGGVMARLSSATGLSIEKANVAKLMIKSVALDARTDDVVIEISGGLQPLIGGTSWPMMEVSQLRIHTDGRVELPGGWLTLPVQKSGGFFGFPLEIRKIGFGTQDGKRWIGFSGGLKLVDGMPVGGSVEGLKILWDPTDETAPPEIELRELAVSVRVPKTLSLDARVAFFKDGEKTWFQGSGTVDLQAIGVTLDAQILVGRTAEYTFFYVFVEAGLPAGIPLFSTGLALYGLGGLVGINVMPDRRDGEGWYDGWYKRDPLGPTNSSKWRDAGGRYAFGASVTLGTQPDNGQAMHGRVLVIVMIPGPTIMIEGRVNLIKDRKEMTPTSEPRFRGLAVLDGEAGTLQVNLEPRFLVPDSGEKPGNLVDVTGMAEAFFDFQRGDRWYLNIGEKDPKERRIRAKLLRLLDANAYLMLNQQRAAFGAMVGYDVSLSYGPFSLRLAFWFETDALLVFRPLQLTADAGIHGRAEFKAFGIGICISLDAVAHVETPEPFVFTAELHLAIDLPWPLPDVNFTVPYEYKEPTRPALIVPLQRIDVLTRKATESWDTSLQEPGQAIPLDSRPVLIFSKGVHDEQRIGGNVQPASNERSGELTFSYHLDEVVLERKVQGAWDVVAAKPAPPGGREIFGMWLPASLGEDGVPNAKLQLFAKTPFEAWGATSSDAAAETFATNNPGYPWVYEGMDFEATPAGTVIGSSSASTAIAGLQFDAGALNPPPLISETAGISELKSVEGIGTHGLLLRDSGIGYVAVGGATNNSSTSGSGNSRRYALRISFPTTVHPGGVRSVRVFLSTRAVLTLMARDASGTALASREIRDDVRTNLHALRGVQHRTIVLTANGICHLDIDYGPTWIHSIEWVPGVAVGSEAAELSHHNAAETNRWGEEEFLFAPNSNYRIRANCRVRAIRANSAVLLPDRPDAGLIGPATLPLPVLQGNSADYVFEQITYMRTDGPPGFLGAEIDRSVAGGTVAMPAGSGTPQAVRSLVRTLQSYVAQVLPGDPDQPFYRAYDVRVEFDESFIARMYTDDQRSLTLAFSDPNGASPASGSRPATIAATWRKAEEHPLRRDEAQWVSLMENGGGPTVPVSARPARDVLDVSVRAPLLSADTKYQASLVPVPDANAADRELYRFTLRTSRYACFAHHVGAFDGHVDVIASPPPALPTVDRARLLSAAQNGTSSDFDNIVVLFGLSTSARPERLRCTVLADASQRWGLLIDSPEPLDSERIGLSLAWYQLPLGSGRVSQAVRILDVHSGDRSNVDYNTEWIDLLALQPGDLHGSRLVLVGGATQPDLIYTFASATPVEEGDVVRVHAGAAPARFPIDGRIHVYRSVAAASASWMFEVRENEIRLVDADSRLVASTFAPPAWMRREAHIVWNSDRTRVLVLPKARPLGCLFAAVHALPAWLQPWARSWLAQPLISLETGLYRLEWSYYGDIRQRRQNAPLLRRAGIVADESAVTQFRIA